MGAWRYGISLQLFNSISHKWDIELNTRREIPYLPHFVYYIHISLQLNSCFKKTMHYHSFKVLNRVCDISAADWLSQTRMKYYHNFLHVVIWFFSVVEISINHMISCDFCCLNTNGLTVRVKLNFINSSDDLGITCLSSAWKKKKTSYNNNINAKEKYPVWMSNKVEATCKGQINVMEFPFLCKVAFTVVCGW